MCSMLGHFMLVKDQQTSACAIFSGALFLFPFKLVFILDYFMFMFLIMNYPDCAPLFENA